MSAENLQRALMTTVILALLLLPTRILWASTTGQLSGHVLDTDGTPVPGVAVAANSPSQIGGIQLAQTDLKGRFHYPRLAPGYYTVRAEHDGFLTQEMNQVQVRLDHLTELRVTLQLATFTDEVAVVESTPVVDPEQVSTGQTFTAEYLQEAALGMENRYYIGMLNQAAGVDETGRYGIRVLGSTQFDNNFQIDGMDVTDPHDQLPGFGSLSFEAIDEVALHTAGFEAEFGRATGGVVNLVTKSGGNRFKGSLDYRYSDSGFQESGEHWDPDEQPTKSSDLNASFGGPVVRDRLWFFTALQSFNEDFTPASAPSTQKWSEQNILGKLTWQASMNWNLVGRVIFNPIEWDYSGSNQFRAPEATWYDTWETLNLQLDSSGVVSDNLLVGLRIGSQEASYDTIPMTRDFTTIGHFNLDTGEAYENVTIENHDERSKKEIDVYASWFLDDLAGSHDLKAGVKFTESGYLDNQCRTGGGQPCTEGVEGFGFRDLVDGRGDNSPFQMIAQTAVGEQSFDGSIWSAYVQDSWRIRPDLTLKLGLRWDSSQQSNDVGQEIADLSMLQPRIGGAWDIGAKGRNVLRASWGRYMHPSALHIAEFTAGKSTPIELWFGCTYGFGISDPGDCAAVSASEGWGYRIDRESWDPAGWVLLPGLIFGSEQNQTSPDLEPMYADELVLAYERELYRRTSLELSYVKKDTEKVIEDTCNGNVPTPTEGADCSSYYVANIPGLSKSYEGLILRVESRALDRLHLIGSYVLSDSKGAVPGWDLSGAFDVYPYHFVNQFGYLADHSRHRIKLNGFVRLPLDFSVAFNGWWNSEFRWAPFTVQPPVPYGRMLLEPRGNRSEPGVYQLDFQAGKAFDIGPTRLKLIATVYNLLDTEIVADLCKSDAGCGEFVLGEPLGWQQPRRYELGVRLEF